MVKPKPVKNKLIESKIEMNPTIQPKEEKKETEEKDKKQSKKKLKR